MQMNESIEDYLERILMIRREKGSCRSIDVANALNVTKPSVSHATKLLRENGYITMDGANLIELTETGSAIAEEMLQRHTMLTEWLVTLGVDAETAETDACRMEHAISEATFGAICEHAGRAKG